MNNLEKSISIYIIEDELLICNILCEVFSNIPYCCVSGGAVSGNIAIKEISEKKPDIVFVDIKLIDESGFDIITLIKQISYEIKVLILSSYCNKTLIAHAFKAGASGYLTKNLSINYLSEAINMVTESSDFYLPQDLGFNLSEVMNEMSLNAKQFSLTKREKEILFLIAKEYSTKEISIKLNISEKTVRNHKSHMMLKLDIKNDAGLVKYAIQLALI